MKAPIDLSRFKVLYGNRVYNAVSLLRIERSDPEEAVDALDNPMYLDVLAINEDGYLVVLYGKSQNFKFIPR